MASTQRDRVGPGVGALLPGARRAPVYRGSVLSGALSDFRDDMLGTLLRASGLGPVVRFRLGPGLPIRSYGVFTPDGAARVLTDAAPEFRKDSLPYAETSAFFGDGLLTSQDERWHRQRRFVAPLFTPRRIHADYLPVLAAEAGRMRADWAAAPQGTVDVHALSVGYTLRGSAVSCSAATSRRSCPASARCSPGPTPTSPRGSPPPCSSPAAGPPPPTAPAAPPAATCTRSSTIEQRRRAGHPDARPDGDPDQQGGGAGGGDLLGRLLVATDPQTGQRLTAAEIRDQALIFLLAGHETTATTLAFTLQLLARHPDVQARVAGEAEQARRAGTLTGDPARAMTYTGQVIKEALRLYPPAYAISRYTRTGDLLSGTEIPAKSNVFIATHAMHHSPAVWAEPDRFLPDRFTPDNVEARHRMAWLPFGAGAHICIGAQLATIELTVALAELTAQHTVIPASADPPAGPIASGLVLRPAGPMPHRLIPRHQDNQ